MARYTLRNGDTEIEVWPLGARLNSVRWRHFDNMVATTETREEALGPKLNFGTLVGPVANRIANGACEIDGALYEFQKNENSKTLLHSGNKSTRSLDWEVAEHSDTSLCLSLVLAHLADDFPGNRRVSARYEVFEDGFDLDIEATTDAPTLINFALHAFWTLDGNGRSGQRLGVRADSYLPIDVDTIPTGEIASVEGTQFDLRTARSPDTTIDHNFCLMNGESGNWDVQVLADRGVGMNIKTDAPGVQIFTGKDVGIAIEPQHWPDAPNHPGFPSILLRPGETYTQSSKYRFFET